MTPEFSRPLRLDRLGAEYATDLDATPAECAALARRLDLPAIAALRCRFLLRRAAAGVIDAKGELRARVTLTDVDTLEPFESEVTEDFALRFVPEDAETHEIDIEAPDEIPYADDRLDLGEAAAEQLALALPPYPRRAG